MKIISRWTNNMKNNKRLKQPKNYHNQLYDEKNFIDAQTDIDSFFFFFLISVSCESTILNGYINTNNLSIYVKYLHKRLFTT